MAYSITLIQGNMMGISFLSLSSPHYLCCKFKEICNILEIIKLLAIHACIRFGKPTAYISPYHTCQSLLCVGFQQFIV